MKFLLIQDIVKIRDPKKDKVPGNINLIYEISSKQHPECPNGF
jgi:hypothetical protein